MRIVTTFHMTFPLFFLRINCVARRIRIEFAVLFSVFLNYIDRIFVKLNQESKKENRKFEFNLLTYFVKKNIINI